MFEPDDEPTAATPLDRGEVQDHTICSATSADPFADRDWFLIEGEANGTFVVETFDLQPTDTAPNADTLMELFQELGELIGINDNRGLAQGGTEPFRGSRITWHPPETRTYLIQVSAREPVLDSATGYRIRMFREVDFIIPDDQGTWSPTSVSPPFILRSDDSFSIQQLFLWSAENLANFIGLDADFQWEFNRLGNEYLDYWSSEPPSCQVGMYWTDLPNPTDWFTEESDDLGLYCNILRRWSKPGSVIDQSWDEEFELKSQSPGDLESDRAYTVRVFPLRDIEDRDRGFFPYVTEAEFCGRGPQPCDASFEDGRLVFGFGFAALVNGLTRP
ncbi:MAG: hypothetical protein AB1449_10500 [Chloroflexota bacterium]